MGAGFANHCISFICSARIITYYDVSLRFKLSYDAIYEFEYFLLTYFEPLLGKWVEEWERAGSEEGNILSRNDCRFGKCIFFLLQMGRYYSEEERTMARKMNGLRWRAIQKLTNTNFGAEEVERTKVS